MPTLKPRGTLLNAPDSHPESCSRIDESAMFCPPGGLETDTHWIRLHRVAACHSASRFVVEAKQRNCSSILAKGCSIFNLRI